MTFFEEEKEVKKRTRKSKVIKYIGKGTYLSDIPARDIKRDEWLKIPLERRKHAIKLKLYKEQE